MRTVLTMLSLAVAAASATPAGAVNLLSDGFEGDTFGLAQTSLNSVSAITGNVDVIGPSFFGIACASGAKCLDLDGSGTGGPTRLTSNNSFSFSAGDTVVFSLDVGGNQRVGTSDNYGLGISFNGNTMLNNYGFNFFGTDVDFGPAFISGFGTAAAINSDEPFARRSLYFTAAESGSFSFSFDTTSADDFGPIVDNLSVDLNPGAVPEPASWVMMIAGMGLAGGALRRRGKLAIA